MSRPALLWDIFCRVIDNHGDLGVCWRLCTHLVAQGQRVRLWVDKPAALAWMAPGGHAGVQVLGWPQGDALAQPGDVAIEAFGCELPTAYQASLAAQTALAGRQPAWINLEYLTAEKFAQRSHGLPSPVMSGAARGLTKHFFYPGFTAATGGLLRESDLAQRQASFDRSGWLRAHGLPAQGERLVSLFCYEPAALPNLLGQLAAGPQPTRLLVTAGRATAAVQQVLRDQPQAGALSIIFLPWLSQRDYDHLLWACDFNFVRGEDSLVRALWAGQPFAWQLYPQHDGAHHAKLTAFLDWLQAPGAWRDFFRAWNGQTPTLPALDAPGWAACAQAARTTLLRQNDLATQLMAWVQASRSA